MNDIQSAHHQIPSVFISNFLLMAIESQSNQFIEQVAVFEAGGFPKFGIHADAGEAGKCVYFIEIKFIGFLIQKEINPRHGRTAQRHVSFNSSLSDFTGKDFQFPREFSAPRLRDQYIWPHRNKTHDGELFRPILKQQDFHFPERRIRFRGSQSAFSIMTRVSN